MIYALADCFYEDILRVLTGIHTILQLCRPNGSDCLVSDRDIDLGSAEPDEFVDYRDAVAWARQTGGKLYYDYEQNRFQVYRDPESKIRRYLGEKVRKEIPDERIRLYEGIFILLVTIGLIIVTKAL